MKLTKRSFLLIMLIMTSVMVQAQQDDARHQARVNKARKAEVNEVVTNSFEAGDIYYNLINDSYLEVTRKGNYEIYDFADITIPDEIEYAGKTYPVRTIGMRAFASCINLQNIHLPKTLKVIKAYAFQSSSLTSVVIPEGVETIEMYAFAWCREMESVQLPASLKNLDVDVFYKDNSLANITVSEDNQFWKVVDNVIYNKSGEIMKYYSDGKKDESFSIPEGVEILGYNAITNPNLKTVTIPASMKDITYESMLATTALEEIKVSKENPYYKSVDGVLFSTNGSLIKYPEARPDESYVIPEGTTNLDDNTFASASNLKKIELPASVVSIGDYFCAGSAVDTLVMRSATPPALHFVYSSFYAAPIVIVPDGCTDIYSQAESWCNFANIVSSRDANNLTFVVNSLKYQKINADEDNMDVRLCGFDVEPNAAKNLTISKTVTYEGKTYTIKEIGGSAFYNCGKLNGVTIPNTITKIGKYAFDGCSMTRVTFLSGSTLEEIGAYAFYGGQIASINMPASLKSIGDNAFCYCGNWDNTHSLTIPANVEHIGKEAFHGCMMVNEFIVNEDNQHFVAEDGVLYNKDMTELICYPYQKTDDTFYLPKEVKTVDCLYNFDLRKLVISAELPPVLKEEETYYLSQTDLFVSPGTLGAYKNDSIWSVCKSITELGSKELALEDGGYWFYNREMDAFLSRGADYGTRATMQKTGVPIILTHDELDCTNMMRYCDSYFTDSYLGFDIYPYTDKDHTRPTTWEIQRTDDNRYVLFLTDYEMWLTGGNLHEGTDFTKDINKATRFEAISSSEEYRDILASRHSIKEEITPTMEELDMTDLIKNPSMSSSTSFWDLQFRQQYTDGNLNIRTGLSETYHLYGQLSQTITGLEPGIYKFSLEGFYRGGTNDMCAFYDNQGIELQSAYIFANDDETPFATWASARMNDTYPNSMEEAYDLISRGLYKTDVYTRVGDDGVLTIGLAEPQGVPYGWMIWRNATLTYYLETAEENAIDSITSSSDFTIYSTSGVQQNGMQKGLNIVKDGNGKVRKVFFK